MKAKFVSPPKLQEKSQEKKEKFSSQSFRRTWNSKTSSSKNRSNLGSGVKSFQEEKVLSTKEKIQEKIKAYTQGKKKYTSKKRRVLFRKLALIWAKSRRQKRTIKKAVKTLGKLKSQISSMKLNSAKSGYKPKYPRKKRVNWYQLSSRAKRKKRLQAEKNRQKRLFRFTLFLRVFGKPSDITNILVLKAFLTKFGKIKSRRKTKLCVQDQRKVAQLIKKARSFQLLPCLSLIKFRVFKRFRKKFKNAKAFPKGNFRTSSKGKSWKPFQKAPLGNKISL
jgi:ribosomal protein S18